MRLAKVPVSVEPSAYRPERQPAIDAVTRKVELGLKADMVATWTVLNIERDGVRSIVSEADVAVVVLL